MWQCQTTSCGYIYNPDKRDRKGKVPEGTLFEDLPDDWKCPVCGASKKNFRPLGGQDPWQQKEDNKDDGLNMTVENRDHKKVASQLISN